MHQLKNKVAIVTGAAGGIGAATARLLAQRGASVVVADINARAADEVVQAIEGSGGVALALHLDLAAEETVVSVVRAALERFGRVDILHNNAADLSPELTRRDQDVESMEAEVWDRTFRVNVRGTMLCCKHVLPSPGLVMTPAARDNLPQRLHEIVASETLTPYLGLAKDIAEVVAFLASDGALYVTGHNLVADGGGVAHVPGFAQFNELAGQA